MAVKKRKKDLSLIQKIYLPEIAKGLAITFRNIVKPKFTMQYPEEKFDPPASFRGRPVLAVENNGEERCVACGLCARICPPLAIEVQASETENEKERFPVKFEINMLRCIFCGFCEEVCPEEAILMSQDYELVFSDRKDAIFGKEKLFTPVSKLKDRIEFLRKFK